MDLRLQVPQPGTTERFWLAPGAHPKGCFIQGAHLDSKWESTFPCPTSLSQAYMVLTEQEGRETAGNPSAHWQSPTPAPRIAWEVLQLNQHPSLPATARSRGMRHSPNSGDLTGVLFYTRLAPWWAHSLLLSHSLFNSPLGHPSGPCLSPSCEPGPALETESSGRHRKAQSTRAAQAQGAAGAQGGREEGKQA